MPTEPTEMVTTPEAQAQDATQPEQGRDGQVFDAARAQALIEKLRAENKAAKESAKKLAEMEAAEAKRKESEMSELEKAQKRLAELESKLKETERREMQRKVGEEYKLPSEIAELLQGDDLDAMKEHAEKLAKALPKHAPISPTNPSASAGTTTDAQKRAFLFGGGPLPK